MVLVALLSKATYFVLDALQRKKKRRQRPGQRDRHVVGRAVEVRHGRPAPPLSSRPEGQRSSWDGGRYHTGMRQLLQLQCNEAAVQVKGPPPVAACGVNARAADFKTADCQTRKTKSTDREGGGKTGFDRQLAQ